jgi:hypothetical protein
MSRAVRFGPFEVSWNPGELSRNGAKLRLQAQPLETPVTRKIVCDTHLTLPS